MDRRPTSVNLRWGSLNRLGQQFKGPKGHRVRYVSEKGAFEFHYFFMRKFWMAYKCMGLVVMPGGFGSLDELFEMLVLLQTKRPASCGSRTICQGLVLHDIRVTARISKQMRKSRFNIHVRTQMCDE